MMFLNRSTKCACRLNDALQVEATLQVCKKKADVAQIFVFDLFICKTFCRAHRTSFSLSEREHSIHSIVLRP